MMAKDITGRRILILATDGFEQSELEVPLNDLKKAGAEVEIASLKTGPIKGWDKDDWGNEVEATLTVSEIEPADWDALVLPGGQINPDKLRADEGAVDLIKGFAEAGKPIAAICHAPWLLIEAGLASGRSMTSYESIRTDLKNAGAQVEDRSVVVDGPFITSRKPDDLKDFVAAITEAVA